MKKTIFLLFFVFSFSLSKAQWVTIPDANFRNRLNIAGFSMCLNGNLLDTTCFEVVNAATLYCNNLNIANLDGIQYFDHLTELYCDHNLLTSLPVLPQYLKILGCGYNQITSLPILPDSLENLNCTNNQLSSLPSLPFSLKVLGCFSNQIAVLPQLPNSLTSLYISSNLLTALPTLPNSITEIYCDHNQLTSLPTLPQLLGSLHCYFNQIDSIPNLPNNVFDLYCGNNLLNSLPPLPSSIKYIQCQNNQISSLPVLPDSLFGLNCSNNLLHSIPDLPMNMSDFDCSYNQLDSLPLLPDSLNFLYCKSNNLTWLPPLHNSILFISVQNNQLTSLPDLPATLQTFQVNNNPNLMCMPPLFHFTGDNGDFDISNTGITCLPNLIIHQGYRPAIDTMPICELFNAHGCQVGWNIMGGCYIDFDGMCSSVNDVIPISMLKMNLKDTNGNLLEQVIANWGGQYSFDTQLGTYKTSVDTFGIPFNVICPLTNNRNHNLTSIDSVDFNMDFRLECKAGFDIGIWDMNQNNFFFPGTYTQFHVFAGDLTQSNYNVSCNSNTGGIVKIILDSLVNYVSPLTNALIPIINGDTLIYNIPDFSLVNSSSDFAFNLSTDSSAQIGDIVCFDVTVTPTSGDNNLSNNHLLHCFDVTNSFDPNEKEVSPVGSLAYPYNDWLTYTIHFQNTGTAAAQHIQVLDTLDADLDASTFQLLSYSFAPLVQITGGNVAFDFININLPDSTTDLQGSQGYVSYRVMPIANLPMGTAIANTASIYFDFNTPVVTNTVSNLICNSTTSTTNATICAGDTYIFEGSSLTVAGNYSVTFQTVDGCDSTLNLNLFVEPVVTNSITQTICSGITFDFNGQQLSAAGNYADTLTAVTGCDSIVNLSLNVLAAITSSINQTICFGDSINFNGNYFDTTGIFFDTLSNSNGCDSIVNLSLTVLAPVNSAISQTICNGETYLFNGINESATGIYFDTLSAFNNCDSIIALHLTVNNPNATIQLNGNTLTATGAGIIQWINCDSGTFVPGIIGGTFIPSVIGHYAAWVWDGLCSDTTICIEVLLDGTNEFATGSMQFAVFPNPVDDIMIIQLSQPCVNCTIEISNTIGQNLFSKIISEKSEKINLQTFSSGIFFVKLKTETGNFVVRKIIKK